MAIQKPNNNTSGIQVPGLTCVNMAIILLIVEFENVMKSATKKKLLIANTHCYFFPNLGDLCAAKYVDDQWYRAKVEKLAGADATILYVDYGNRATIPKSKCASLPGAFTALPPYAKEYSLALCAMAQDVSFVILPTLSQSVYTLHNAILAKI